MSADAAEASTATGSRGHEPLGTIVAAAGHEFTCFVKLPPRFELASVGKGRCA